MSKENKRCVYVEAENLSYLQKIAEKLKKNTLSHAINTIISEYRKIKRFIVKDEKYISVKISMRVELYRILEKVKEKSKDKGDKSVCDLINIRLLEEFYYQIKENKTKFPDRLYNDDDYINRLSDKVSDEFIKKLLKR